MPLYSKKDFADLCFTTTSDLSNYIRRGKVVVSVVGEGDAKQELIDSSNELNAAFYVKRQSHQVKKTAISGLPGGDKNISDHQESGKEKVKEQKKEPPPKFEFSPELGTTMTEQIRTEADQKLRNVEKTTLDIELQKLKIDKMRGEVIPTQLVTDLIRSFSKQIVIDFRNGAENLLIEITKKTGLTDNDVASLRGSFIEIINAAVNEAIEATDKGLDHIVDEYSKSRGVGEKE